MYKFVTSEKPSSELLLSQYIACIF